MATPLSFRAQIHALLDRFFDEEELQTLCFELGADFDNLSGDTKTSKARELIEWCERSEKMTALRAAIVRLRPNAQDELAAIPETEKAPVQPIRPTPQPAQPKVQGWVWSAAAGLGLIGIVASVWFGLRGRQVAPTTTPRVATSTPQPALPTAMPPTAQATSAASRDADQLEAALTAANIQLSDGPDTTNKVREYLASDMEYIQLAENCLRILAGRRLTKP